MTETAGSHEWAENATTNPLKFACPDPTAHETAGIAKAVDDLDKVSQRLSRAGGMALTTGLTELVSLIGDAGCDLDDVINDLQELADGTCNCSTPAHRDARYDGATDEQVAETILADLNYKRLPYERALIVTTAHVRNIRAAALREASDAT